MNPLRLASVALAFLLAVSIADGQNQAPATRTSSQATAQQPVFRAGVELVRLDVRVVDGNGEPITDLRPDEVTVEEGGQKRPIVLFQHVAEPRGSYLEVARKTIGAEVSTNQGAPRGHLYVFVFDQGHITLGNEQRARAAVERFLRTRVKPGDRVALYAIPGPGPQLGFSSSTSAAIGELSKVRGMLDRDVAVGVAPMSQYEAYQIARGDQNMVQRVLQRSSASGTALDVAGGAATRQRQTNPLAGTAASASDQSLSQATQIVVDAARGIVSNADGESRTFLNILSDIIRQLGPIEGRKAVILVSEGFYADNVAHDLDRVSAAAAEAYAVVYSLDVNRRGADFAASAPVGADQANEIVGRMESLGALSAETSGELILDASTQMDAALNRVAESSQDYYILGFEPPLAAASDRHDYRRVKVSVARPGARVQTRTGYSLRDPVGPADRRRTIDTALAAPFAQQGLPLEMTTYVLHGTSPGAQRVFMSLEAELPVRGGSGPRSADVVFVARNASDGRVAASGTDTIPLPSVPEPGRTTAPGRYNVQFDLPAGEYLMRAVVREPGGAAGTVDRRFEVRALDGADITASDLIVGRRQDRLPVRPVAYVDGGLTGALEIYARNPADLASASVTVDLFRVGGESPVRSVRADLSAARPVGNGAARAADIELPLTGVPPGDFVARATVRAQDEVVTELMRQVQVLPGAGPPPSAVVPPEAVTPAMIAGGELGRRFVASLARSDDPLLQKAAAQASLGAWDKALALLGSADARSSADAHALRGLSLFALGRIAPAADSMEQAWAIEANSPLAAFILGWTRRAVGRLPEAISAWRAAVALDPMLVSGYLALADTYVKLGHPELANQALREGLGRMPDSPELRSRLAEVER